MPRGTAAFRAAGKTPHCSTDRRTLVLSGRKDLLQRSIKRRVDRASTDAPTRSGPAKRENACRAERKQPLRPRGLPAMHGQTPMSSQSQSAWCSAPVRGPTGSSRTGSLNWGRLSPDDSSSTRARARLALAAATLGRASATARGLADGGRRNRATARHRHGLCRNQQGDHPHQGSHGNRLTHSLRNGAIYGRDNCQKQTDPRWPRSCQIRSSSEL